MVIYKITNLVNNKLYIGQTVNFDERKRHHKETAFNKNSKAYNYPLYKAIRKYSWEQFTIDVIYTAQTIEELNEKEIQFIEEFQSCVDTDKGYNLDKGGKNGLKSEYTKAKMSKAQSGKNNPGYGKKGGLSHHAIKIKNMNTGVIYDSMIDCAIAEYNDPKIMKQLSRVTDPNSNRQTYKGVVYRRLDKDGNIIEKNISPK